MQAVVKVAPGVGHVELREVPEPQVGPGQVKIAVEAAAICGTDLHIYDAEYASRPPVRPERTSRSKSCA
jgi:L-iditol 2-dehydrogenase